LRTAARGDQAEIRRFPFEAEHAHAVALEIDVDALILEAGDARIPSALPMMDVKMTGRF